MLLIKIWNTTTHNDLPINIQTKEHFISLDFAFIFCTRCPFCFILNTNNNLKNYTKNNFSLFYLLAFFKVKEMILNFKKAIALKNFFAVRSSVSYPITPFTFFQDIMDNILRFSCDKKTLSYIISIFPSSETQLHYPSKS